MSGESRPLGYQVQIKPELMDIRDFDVLRVEMMSTGTRAKVLVKVFRRNVATSGRTVAPEGPCGVRAVSRPHCSGASATVA